ncbi:tetratricopeptide repeat protein [Nitrosomonas ureae]|uniref:Tetratricopeptide repeat-containing protein n=1 Tax=Nitrosomonas ureae TaxID=44577 RepID=A0A1H2EIY0_9PROT|nr:tetratricopeptide repeat protein [Nitrosomonas ureae]ALQ50317.1 hypothetical protein ATY38_03150 [Nitrosomonas ureae]SDT95024.1 Tetratricopeptide repeat-containing protein [Nitrosomonas ureae]
MQSEDYESVQQTPEGEQQWQRLLNHLRWSDAFSLILIFSRHAQVVQLFRARLEQFYRLRISGLNSVPLETADQLLTVALPALLGKKISHELTGAPVWLDLTRTNHDEHWPETRRKFYRRLNENRETLREQNRAIIIVLPTDERQLLRELAPDLWAIRDLTVETDNWIVRSDSTIASDHTEHSENISELPLSASDQQLIDEWHRVKNKQDRGVLLAADRALDICLPHAQLQLAWDIAGSMVKLARHLNKADGETPQSLRDLSISLDNVGNVARERGDLKDAQVYYAESLALSRQLLQQLGETPQSLRDLSISLDNVGNVARERGDLKDAQVYYAESLALRRQLLQQLGETPQSLRDLSVSVDKMGDVARERGELNDAQVYYAESLALRRQLLQQLGETPQSLRDLSVSVDKMGDVARERGELKDAQDYYAESQHTIKLLDKNYHQ